jgi:hypothetical protein
VSTRLIPSATRSPCSSKNPKVPASLLVLSVAALTLSPGVRRDVEQRAIAQQVREREAAAAARRARSGH